MAIDLRGGGEAPHPEDFAGGATARRSLHILLVDDDELVRAGTAEMLADAGHEVTEAASAVEALAIFEADHSIELLITDYLMPEMNGAALIARVRRDAPKLSVLLITGYASRDEDIAADVGLLAKPFRQAGLTDAVQNLMGGVSEYEGVEPRDWPSS